jgi:hypothetical protein
MPPARASASENFVLIEMLNPTPIPDRQGLIINVAQPEGDIIKLIHVRNKYNSRG